MIVGSIVALLSLGPIRIQWFQAPWVPVEVGMAAPALVVAMANVSQWMDERSMDDPDPPFAIG